jgi:DNA-binding NtrC family response regulator
MNPNEKILLVDDDLELLKVYKQIFAINGFNIITVSDPTEASKIVSTQKVAVVITDIIMPKMGGMELLSRIKEVSPSTEVIMLTAEGSVSGAVNAVRRGAFTYLVKPADIDDLLLNVRKAFDVYTVREENTVLKQQVIEGYAPLIGNNSMIDEIRNKVATIAPTDIVVLLTGESGTGKEILANLIHNSSSRREKPFIKVNCAALTENLLESELFGHERGAFTGAEKTYRGRFEMANRGTLLLDEIGELPLNTQGKLLRVIQEKEFERVGSSSTIKTDFRLITSTNRNLSTEVEKGHFRRDLFYRINVFPIHVPPLRKRKDDIPILMEYFTEKFCLDMKRPRLLIPSGVADIFVHYDWPGNVRELQNVIERLVVLSQNDSIRIEDIPEEIKVGTSAKAAEKDKPRAAEGSLLNARHVFERECILKALDNNEWNITRTAKELKLARKNLYKKMKEYGIANL